MNESTKQPESTLFTVRIWRYEPKHGSLLWRGKVHDVSSGAWRYFHNWDDLVGFLNGKINVRDSVASEKTE